MALTVVRNIGYMGAEGAAFGESGVGPAFNGGACAWPLAGLHEWLTPLMAWCPKVLTGLVCEFWALNRRWTVRMCGMALSSEPGLVEPSRDQRRRKAAPHLGVVEVNAVPAHALNAYARANFLTADDVHAGPFMSVAHTFKLRSLPTLAGGGQFVIGPQIMLKSSMSMDPLAPFLCGCSDWDSKQRKWHGIDDVRQNWAHPDAKEPFRLEQDPDDAPGRLMLSDVLPLVVCGHETCTPEAHEFARQSRWHSYETVLRPAGGRLVTHRQHLILFRLRYTKLVSGNASAVLLEIDLFGGPVCSACHCLKPWEFAITTLPP